MDGTELSTLVDEVNGGASIGATLKFQLLNLAKALIEQRRPWVLLRETDTSRTVATGNTWQTAISLASITDFSRFYESDTNAPIKLFDGNNNVVEYRQRPWNERLRYKDAPNTFVFNLATKTLYLNSTVQFAGTLYIDYLSNSDDLEADDDSEWVFPSWSHSLLAFFAVAIHKGGIDYDDINARMSPENRATAEMLIRQLEGWDNELQLSGVSTTDPYPETPGYRSGAIDTTI